ncbi:amidohydrolase family protein, partial [Cupriavidus plantarum]|uniref:amidohydrolase family protein n=1 Tax=Cupriavidus plantarum TaxID=942865 RepID=UPI00339D6798
LGHYERDRELLPLTVDVNKMTGLSDERFGLMERGFVREGYWADLVLFDPATIRDAATFTEPVAPAEGIEAVWVNGELSWQQRAPTGLRAGRFIARAPSLRA